MKEKKKYDWTVHYDIKGRKKYKAKLWCVIGIMVIILCGCAALFTFGNVKWDPETGFSPGAQPDYAWQIVLNVAGGVIALAAMVLTTIYCFLSINRFYKGQAEYFKTKIFRDHKARALNKDLTKLNKKTLKWYKKLGYIDSAQMREILEKKKSKKKEATS